MFTAKHFARYMTGTPLHELTRSQRMSLARKQTLGTWLLEVQRRYGFRRNVYGVLERYRAWQDARRFAGEQIEEPASNRFEEYNASRAL